MRRRRGGLLLLFLYLMVMLTMMSCNETDLESNFDQIILSNQDKVLVGSANNFGFDLLKLSSLSKYNKNIIISPLELSSDLNLLLNGCSGSMFNLIDSYINPSNLSTNEINNSYKRIIEAIQGLSNNNLILTNGFWFRQNMGVNPHFISVSNFFYKTYIDSTYFNEDRHDNQIENWLNSNSRIQFSFTPELSDNIQSVFINAFSCDLNFKYLFTERKKEPFWISESDTIMVQMLKVNESYKLFSNDYFSLIELPYSNNSFSLIIVLPNNDVDMQTVLSTLNSSNWNYWIKNASRTLINLSLPEIDISETLELGGYIRNSIFNYILDESVDFSGIVTTEGFSINNLYSISAFKILDNHLSFNQADKNQVELAKGVQFQINKPFLFAIKENSSNLVLQVGVIKYPKRVNK